VLGREFSIDALASISDSGDVQGQIAVLMRAGIVTEVSRYPRLECAFRHGLVHEAALSTLTSGRRKALYTRVGRALEELYAGSIDEHLDELAFHYYRSDDLTSAKTFLQRAAEATELRQGADAAAPAWRRLHSTASELGDEATALSAKERLEAAGQPLRIAPQAAGTSASPEVYPVEASDTIGGYVVEETIGEGATGIVYRAIAPDGGEVALKVLKQELAQDETFAKRFAHEARAAQEVHNDHLVDLISSGEEAGRLFIAMQYVPGATLKDRLESGSLQPLPTARIVRQVASALDALHGAGVMHRDLKPANIMVSDAGEVVLTDLGLAKGRAYTVLTRPGQLLGTLDYMAPELIKGGPASAASDVYSLAVIAFECMTGRAPFADLPVLEVGLAHMNKEPANVSELDPGIPPDVGWTIARALSKDPSERPPTAGAFASMLRMAVGT
jgi:serine/threonine-protein kinase